MSTAAAVDCGLAVTHLTPSQLAAVRFNPPISDLAEGLEAPIQLLYLLALLGFLAAGAYLVVRQVFVRRDLEEAAKVLGDRIRSDSGNAEVRIVDPAVPVLYCLTYKFVIRAFQ